MTCPMTLLACPSAAALSACVETTDPIPLPAVTGGNLTSVAAKACQLSGKGRARQSRVRLLQGAESCVAAARATTMSKMDWVSGWAAD